MRHVQLRSFTLDEEASWPKEFALVKGSIGDVPKTDFNCFLEDWEKQGSKALSQWQDRTLTFKLTQKYA